MSDTTSKSILEVRFREKVRGYHQGDVDAFVSQVAATVEELQARVSATEARAAELEARSNQNQEADESLRRTLVLAQRTADLAVQEARAEAAKLVADAEQQRDTLLAEVADMRSRLKAEVEEEVRVERDRLFELRRGLQADVDALRAHLERERERLRIYFTDQLQRLDDGQPGIQPAPEMQAPAAPAAPAPESTDAAPPDEASAAAGEDEVAEEDPFLAELRRAVTDDEPLGPREPPPADDDEDGFDLFAQGGDQAGRFGSRRRRWRDS